MTYRIVHKTTYKYKNAVSVGSHAVYLTPRSLPHHRCTWHELRIKPEPPTRIQRVDYFGNHVNFFTVQGPHGELIAKNGLYASLWARQRQAEKAREELAHALEEAGESPLYERGDILERVEPS